MHRFILRRVFQAIVVIVLVTVGVFIATRVLGDPVRQMLPIGATDQQQDALRHTLGLDQPMLAQLPQFLGDLLRLDFGRSIWQDVPALPLVIDRLPATFILLGAAMVLAVSIFVPLGAWAALRPGGIGDRILSSIALLAVSMPQFWIGAMLIWLFAARLGWLPTSGRGGVEHLVLPALTLASTTGGRLGLTARTAIGDELKSPYVDALRAKGLPDGYILWRHVLRTAIVPILTVGMWESATMLAGTSVIVETVFAWPGIGLLLIQAIEQNDIFLVQAIVLVTALLVVAVNAATDILYRVADSRIELR